jgi:hypothetical protein
MRRSIKRVQRTSIVLGWAVCFFLLLASPASAADKQNRDHSENGIYLESVKTYDESSLQHLLTVAINSLSQLTGFDQATLTKQVGQIQGANATQSLNALSIAGPGGSAPTGASATAPNAPNIPNLGVSSLDFLNEQLQLSLQIANIQLLLGGALDDQAQQGFANLGRRRITLGFPIYIGSPAGFKYQGAVAEVEVTVCPPTDAAQLGGATLVTLLPQEKTYNVASYVSKGTSIGGGGTIAGVLNVGGSFLRGRQTYYLVQDQDTLAMEHPPRGACASGAVPVTFAWQFRPVLGQKAVHPGLRQTFAQISVPVAKLAENFVTCPPVVRLRTGWRRYDLQSGHVGEPIELFRERELQTGNFGFPPAPTSVKLQDNGEGSVTILAYGDFNAGTRVRIGSTVLSETNPGSPAFEHNEKYIRFKTDALSLATNGASLVNSDGLESDVQFPPQKFRRDTFGSFGYCAITPANTPDISYEKRSDGHVVLTISSVGAQFMDGPVTLRKELSQSDLPNYVPTVVTNSVEFHNSDKGKGSDKLIADLTVPKDISGNYDVTAPTSIGFILAGCLTFPKPSQCSPSPPPPPDPWILVPREGTPGEKLNPVLTRRSAVFDPLHPPVVKFGDSTVPDVTVIPPNAIIFPVTVPDKGRVNVTLTPSQGPTVPSFQVKRAIKIDITPFDDTTAKVALDLPDEPLTAPKDALQVVVIGSKVFGLRDNPFYNRTDSQVSLLAPYDLIRTNPRILWSNLVTAQRQEYPLNSQTQVKDQSAQALEELSEFAISNITPVSATGGGGDSKSPSAASSNVIVTTGAIAVTGAGLITIGDGTPLIASVTPASGSVGPDLIPITITGAFTHFSQTPAIVTFSDPNVTPALPPEQVDDTHLKVLVTVKTGAKPGPLNVTVQAGAEVVVGSGVFTVTTAAAPSPANPGQIVSVPSIVSVSPASFQPGETRANVVISGQSTQFNAASTVKFSNPGITASNPQFDATKPSQLAVTLNVSPDALSAAAGSGPPAAPPKVANTYAITGSKLNGLKLVSPAVEVTQHGDTLVTFSLTDDQAKLYKNILLQHGSVYKLLTLPPPTPPPAPKPGPKNLAAPISSDYAKPLDIPGTGMTQVVAVRYLVLLGHKQNILM